MGNLPGVPNSVIVSESQDQATGRRRTLGYCEADWYQWFLALWNRVNRSAERLTTKRLTGQEASIGATSLPLGSLSPGMYRVTWRFRVTRAATTNSSLLFTLGWTDANVVMSRSSTAKTGNTTATEDNDTWVIRIDQASAVTYATTYASTGATPMQYELEIAVESVP